MDLLVTVPVRGRSCILNTPADVYVINRVTVPVRGRSCIHVHDEVVIDVTPSLSP